MRNALIILFLTCFSTAGVAQSANSEANLKAVFIYNFTQYIDWDSSHINNNFIIGVVGHSDVTAGLIEIAKTGSVFHKKISVQVYNKLEEIGKCEILFIPRTTPFPLPSIISRIDRGVLTVSESPGFAKEGTAFNFVLVNNKLKFETNLKAIAAAGLRASSQLLKLATTVY